VFRSSSRGFTLLEVVTVIVIVGILSTMLIPAYTAVRAKVQRVSCTGNLKNLYFAANSYTQDRQQWPQIPATDIRGAVYVNAWVSALEPYGIQRVSWICPTIQDLMGNPDYTQGGKVRMDYQATPFRPSPKAPYLKETQPWFVERGDVHGDGNLLIFASGEINSLKGVMRDDRFKRVSPF
jgi:prepilin-type N-terminal cleavage/methylation domain-containing protein